MRLLTKNRQPIFQSSLPRGERLKYFQVYCHFYDFNPRSREGSDAFAVVVDGVINDFNPRSREGSDGYSKHDAESADHISILAPARGATMRVLKPEHTLIIFQSSLPRGERLGLWSSSIAVMRYFNPRSREGSDSNFSQKSPYIFS